MNSAVPIARRARRGCRPRIPARTVHPHPARSPGCAAFERGGAGAYPCAEDGRGGRAGAAFYLPALRSWPMCSCARGPHPRPKRSRSGRRSSIPMRLLGSFPTITRSKWQTRSDYYPRSLPTDRRGRVVNRPASVVKEMMENAIDAGATSVRSASATAAQGLQSDRRRRLRNAPARRAHDADRHATSKIGAVECYALHTFGFRGKALKRRTSRRVAGRTAHPAGRRRGGYADQRSTAGSSRRRTR